MFYSTAVPSPVGLITLASDGHSLTGLWIAGQKYHGQSMLGQMAEQHDLPLFQDVKRWLTRYFSGERPAVSELPLAPAGGAFRQNVWEILCQIPYGEVITYGAIAQKIAAKMCRPNMSSQAVGGAVGHNPISIIIPCHRVVGANGSLTGYAAGVGIKAKLLQLEGVDMSRLFLPKRGTAL